MGAAPFASVQKEAQSSLGRPFWDWGLWVWDVRGAEAVTQEKEHSKPAPTQESGGPWGIHCDWPGPLEGW